MKKLRRGIKRGFLFIILFAIFHLIIGGRMADSISSYVYADSNEAVINTLTPIASSSSHLSSLEYANLLNGTILGANASDSKITTTDPRVLAMRQFLIDKYSPLYTYADVFVNEADKYGLDWRLVASISGVESAFGNLIPYQSNNGWGWRGGPGGAYSIFPTWRHGIERVTSRLALGYGTELTPFDIEPVYCPPCGQNPQHAWANGVTQFMNQLDYYVKNLESVY